MSYGINLVLMETCGTKNHPHREKKSHLRERHRAKANKPPSRFKPDKVPSSLLIPVHLEETHLEKVYAREAIYCYFYLVSSKEKRKVIIIFVINSS